jgi:hypothetical protein
LALEANESSSGDEVQEVGAPRGKSQQLYFTFQLTQHSGIGRSTTGMVDSAGGRTVDVTGKGTGVASN